MRVCNDMISGINRFKLHVCQLQLNVDYLDSAKYGEKLRLYIVINMGSASQSFIRGNDSKNI